MLNVTYNINDMASPAIQAKLAQCDPHRIATRVAVRVSTHWRNHLAGMPKNRNGYPSTGFWEDAARRVVGIADGGTAKISSDKLGLQQRYYGGTITAKNANNLTIPICAEAYGTKVSDWGFDNLVLVILADGRKFLALWLGSEEAQSTYQKNFARLASRASSTTRRAGKLKPILAYDRMRSREIKKPSVIIFRKSGGSYSGARAEREMKLKFLFVLKKSVEQAGNPDVIPDDIGIVATNAALEVIK